MTVNEGSGKQVLVVEDDAYIRVSIIEILEEEGYQVFGATNGRDAMNFLQKVNTLPSLILLDLMMPIMDGWQFRLEQEKDARLKVIPLVVVTADGSAQDKAMRIRAQGWIKKPIDISVLLNTVKTCCA